MFFRACCWMGRYLHQEKPPKNLVTPKGKKQKRIGGFSEEERKKKKNEAVLHLTRTKPIISPLFGKEKEKTGGVGCGRARAGGMTGAGTTLSAVPIRTREPACARRPAKPQSVSKGGKEIDGLGEPLDASRRKNEGGKGKRNGSLKKKGKDNVARAITSGDPRVAKKVGARGTATKKKNLRWWKRKKFLSRGCQKVKKKKQFLNFVNDRERGPCGPDQAVEEKKGSKGERKERP